MARGGRLTEVLLGATSRFQPGPIDTRAAFSVLFRRSDFPGGNT